MIRKMLTVKILHNESSPLENQISLHTPFSETCDELPNNVIEELQRPDEITEHFKE